MNKIIIFDMDDACDDHNPLPWLLEMKELWPKLKVSLFTIPNKTSPELLTELVCHDWIRVLVHGFDHNDNYECATMTAEVFKEKMFAIKHLAVYDRIFKAPGWQISEDVLKVLKEWEWPVAVQWSDGRFNGDINGPFQPKVPDNAPFYAFREVLPPFQAIHGHTWEVCGNGPKDLEPILQTLTRDTEFIFIEDYVKTPKDLPCG